MDNLNIDDSGIGNDSSSSKNEALPSPTNEAHHERETLLLMLLAQVCSLHDATPRTFVVHVLALFERGILDNNSIRFLFDLGLVPKVDNQEVDHGDVYPPSEQSVASSQQTIPTDVMNTYFNSNNPLAIVPYTPQPNHPWAQYLPSVTTHSQRSQESISRQQEATMIRRHLERHESLSESSHRKKRSLSSQLGANQKESNDERSNAFESTTRNTLANLPTPWSVEHHPLTLSRYQRDFHQVSLLATGSFGSVYHSIHKLEAKPYAVKRVTFLNSGYLSSMLALVVREVRCLAMLDHPNCVRYYTSWLEPSWMTGDQHIEQPTYDDDYFQSNDANDRPKLLTDIERVVNSIRKSDEIDDTVEKLEALLYGKDDGFDWTDSKSEKQSASLNRSWSNLPPDESKRQYASSLDSAGDVEDSDVSEWTNGDESHVTHWDSKYSTSHNVKRERINSFHEVHSSMHEYDRQESLELVKVDNNAHRDNPKVKSNLRRSSTPTSPYKYQICLFIQMQLCRPTTLSDWIRKRNDACVHFYAEEKQKRARPAFIIFRQIVNGLEHVHSKGIIHRDLKPTNIFACDNGNWCIGDFGLSKMMRDAHPLARSPKNHEDYSSESFTEGHTTGVGTASYAAPEQITESDYGPEVDIFSLGIILLELFSNFTSEHERARAFYNLRHHRELDQWIHRTYPEVAALVLACTQTDHQKRPTATDILSARIFHEGNCTELFAAEVNALKDEIDQRDNLIDMQNDLLKEKDREIEELRQRLSQVQCRNQFGTKTEDDREGL